MRKLLFFIILCLIPFVVSSDETYIDGYEALTTEVQEFDSMTSAPSVSPANKARLYYNSTDDKLKLSENGGAYGDIGAGDITGPGSSTDNAIPTWDGTGGDTLQDTGVLIDDNENLTVPGDIDLTDDTPHIAFDPSGGGDTFEFYSWLNELYCTNVTDEIVLWKVGEDNHLYTPRNFTSSGTGTFDKLSLTNTVTSFDDILVDNKLFGIQGEDDSTYFDFYLFGPPGQGMWFNLYADGGEYGNPGLWQPNMSLYADYINNICSFYSNTAMNWSISDDVNDYIRFQTVADIPEITTVGDCDLKINATGGDIITTANLSIDSDTKGLVLGDAQDATLKWDDSEQDVTLDNDLWLKDLDPALYFAPTVGDKFHIYAYGNELYCTNVDDSKVLWRVRPDNLFELYDQGLKFGNVAPTDNYIWKYDAVLGYFNLEADATGAGGSAITFDIGDDGGNDSTDLNEIATTGDTNSIITLDDTDKMLIDMGQNWPTADAATTATTATTANAGDAASDFFGAGVHAVTDGTACTDIEGTKLSIAGGTLNCTETDSVVGAVSGIVKADGGGNISAASAGTDYMAATLLGDLATTAPVTGAAADIFPGANGNKATIALDFTAAWAWTGAGQITVPAAADIICGTTTLAETTAANDCGAYLIGTNDEFDLSASANVQDVLDDLDAAIVALDTGADGDVDSFDATALASAIVELDPNVDSHAEIIAIIDNTATDVGTGVWTAAGFSVAADENFTLGSSTIQEDSGSGDIVLDNDLLIEQATPWYGTRDTDTNTGFIWHNDESEEMGPWQGLALFDVSYSDSVYSVASGTPAIYVDTSNKIQFPHGIGGTGRSAFTKGITIEDSTLAHIFMTPKADAPTVPVEGSIYADTDHKLYYYDGTSWDDMTASAGGGDPDQNLWETVAGDSGSTAADSVTDTLTIAGGGINVTAMSGDTLTVTATEAQTLATVLALGADGNDVDQTSLGKLEFFDAGLYLDADADGVMNITSDGTLELHSADWDISTTGVMTGIGNITSNGTILATVYEIGDASVDETELEILDGATITTTILNYLDGTTGVTGTDNTNLVYSASPEIDSPTFTTAITATDLIDSAHYVADSIDDEHIDWANLTSPTLSYICGKGADYAGTVTVNGLTLAANENITLGSQTLDHDGTDFVFNDDVTISAAGPDLSLKPTVGDTFGFHVEPSMSQAWLSNETDSVHYIFFDTDHTVRIGRTGNVPALEIPHTAGDVTCDTAGEMAVDTTQKQLVINDGIEKAIPLRHTIQGQLGTADYDADPDVFIMSLDADTYPDGIIITKWAVDCNEADPTTELAATLNYCDDRGAGAFPGASATLIDTLTTTTGNSAETTMSNSDLGSGIIPTGKELYAIITADPTSDTTLFRVKIHFYIPES